MVKAFRKALTTAAVFAIQNMATLFFIAGLLAIVVALWQVSAVVGGVALGISLIVIALLLDRAASPKERG